VDDCNQGNARWSAAVVDPFDKLVMFASTFLLWYKTVS